MMRRDLVRWKAIAFVLAAAVCAHGSVARTLEVGEGKEFPVPSAAAAVADGGDRIEIQPGQYYDCAIWKANNLEIAGAGPADKVVITDTTCAGKASFVVTSDNVTIRDLTLARARVPDGNGAGIRLEGDGLTLERVRFINDQVGLLSGGAGARTIRIADCQFEEGGRGGDHPLFAVMVAEPRVLRIEGSTFKGVLGGQISTAAVRTELAGNHIGTGTGTEPAVAVLSTGGSLIVEDNVFSVGPNAPRVGGAVLAMGDGTLALRRNRLENSTGKGLALLLNWTPEEPVGEGNQAGPGDEVLSSSGLWRHRAAGAWHGMKDGLHGFAGSVKRGLLGLVGR
jgi:hypothetical protein